MTKTITINETAGRTAPRLRKPPRKVRCIELVSLDREIFEGSSPARMRASRPCWHLPIIGMHITWERDVSPAALSMILYLSRPVVKKVARWLRSPTGWTQLPHMSELVSDKLVTPASPVGRGGELRPL